MTSDRDDKLADQQREVEQTLNEIMDAVRRKDVDHLEGLNLYGPSFTKFDDFEPLGRQDAETCRHSEREGLLGLKAADFRFHELKVDLFGEAAVATFILGENMTTEAETISVKARSTMVFVRGGNRWKIAHEHFSAFKTNP
jgi:ketosteroid isomerase-like protein